MQKLNVWPVNELFWVVTDVFSNTDQNLVRECTEQGWEKFKLTYPWLGLAAGRAVDQTSEVSRSLTDQDPDDVHDDDDGDD